MLAARLNNNEKTVTLYKTTASSMVGMTLAMFTGENAAESLPRIHALNEAGLAHASGELMIDDVLLSINGKDSENDVVASAMIRDAVGEVVLRVRRNADVVWKSENAVSTPFATKGLFPGVQKTRPSGNAAFDGQNILLSVPVKQGEVLGIGLMTNLAGEAIIEGLTAGSAAEGTGVICAGDTITAINGTPVLSEADARNKLNGLTGEVGLTIGPSKEKPVRSVTAFWG